MAVRMFRGDTSQRVLGHDDHSNSGPELHAPLLRAMNVRDPCRFNFLIAWEGSSFRLVFYAPRLDSRRFNGLKEMMLFALNGPNVLV